MMHRIDIYSDVARVNKCVAWCHTNLNNNEWKLNIITVVADAQSNNQLPEYLVCRRKDLRLHLRDCRQHPDGEASEDPKT